MEEYIYDSSNGLWYELHGDYYIPCLVIPEEEIHTIGIWGRKHLNYIKEYCPVLYDDLILSGKLYSYLADIDTQARNRLALMTKQMAEKEGINGLSESAGSACMGQGYEQHPQSCGGDH